MVDFSKSKIGKIQKDLKSKDWISFSFCFWKKSAQDFRARSNPS